MLNNPELSIMNPDIVTIAENIQELVSQCQGGIGVQLNSESVSDLSTYSMGDFDFEIIGSEIASSKLLNLYFGKREIGISNIKEMILYQATDADRIVRITLVCENRQIIIFMDIDHI